MPCSGRLFGEYFGEYKIDMLLRMSILKECSPEEINEHLQASGANGSEPMTEAEIDALMRKADSESKTRYLSPFWQRRWFRLTGSCTSPLQRGGYVRPH